MIKSNLVLGIVIITTIILLCMMFAFSIKSENAVNIDFLEGYGWDVEKEPTEKIEFQIPEYFDEVYQNYNILQEEAGLDLNPYRGYMAVRYTYRVKNFPIPDSGEVFANVICVDNIPVAGDICTYAIDGFMYSLNFNTQTCFNISKSNIT